MKLSNYLLIALTAIAFTACNSRGSNNVNDKTAEEKQFSDTPLIEKTISENTANNYTGSTYDLSGVEQRIIDGIEKSKERLKQLSDDGVFSSIHEIILQNLSRKHRRYFRSKPEFELIFWANGNIFHNDKDDHAFVVYDKTHRRITILVYDESANKYSELYRDIEVVNELENCNYGTFGTLDYQLGQEFWYHEVGLKSQIKNGLEEYALFYRSLKITNILNDDDFILESGCWSKNVCRKNPINALCIAKSFIYSNWECLVYDQSRNIFRIVFGQAFSD